MRELIKAKVREYWDADIEDMFAVEEDQIEDATDEELLGWYEYLVGFRG